MRFAFIHVEKAHHKVGILCRVLNVSRSGYYAWLRRPASRRELANRTLRKDIEQAFSEGRKHYGSPRVWREVRKRHPRVGRHRIAKLMKRMGLFERTCEHIGRHWV